MINRRTLLSTLVASGVAAGLAALAGPASSQSTAPAASTIPPVDTGNLPGVAVSGFDPVAYFVDKRPVRGSRSITTMHEGVEWRFVNDSNRRSFLADPGKYKPQFGGYCSWAVSQGYTAPSDPTAWRIQDGKLYLNYSRAIQQRWEQDIPGNISLAQGHWPKIRGPQ
jgi:hypothetical protein